MEIGGLPLHPLVVHAAVTLVPLSGGFAVAFAVLPRWRWLLRWPTALVALGAVVVAWAARLTGKSLLDSRPDLLESTSLREQIERHQQLGEMLSMVVIPFALIVLLGAWSLSGTSALASGKGARDSHAPALEKALPAVLVVAGIGVLVLVVLVGDSGSRAVWG